MLAVALVIMSNKSVLEVKIDPTKYGFVLITEENVSESTVYKEFIFNPPKNIFDEQWSVKLEVYENINSVFENVYTLLHIGNCGLESKVAYRYKCKSSLEFEFLLFSGRVGVYFV